MNGQSKILFRSHRQVQQITLLFLTISFAYQSEAMPANPGSLKQNIMSGDLMGDTSVLGTGGNMMSPIGGSLQPGVQDPKLTPVRGTKDEQCSDKETLIMKLEHDLKDAECTLQAEVNELQRALVSSNGAERQIDRFADQQLSVLNQALNVDRSAICHAQEVASAKACRVRQQPGGGKIQRSSQQDNYFYADQESQQANSGGLLTDFWTNSRQIAVGGL